MASHEDSSGGMDTFLIYSKSIECGLRKVLLTFAVDNQTTLVMIQDLLLKRGTISTTRLTDVHMPFLARRVQWRINLLNQARK
jgi:hypothetical protein